MGVVSKFMRDLDPAKDVEQQLNETLGILVKLAQTKLNTYRMEMNNSWDKGGDDSLAPGVTKDFQDEQMHVITSTDNQAIQDSIGKIVDTAFSLGTDQSAKNVGTFIKTLASQGLDLVLGSGSAEENEHKQYIIYPDKNFLCRCDVWYWRYSMLSKGFQQKLQNVVVFRMQYGAVDITKVSPIALAHWFDKWGLDTEAAKATLEQAKSLILNAKSNQPVLLSNSLDDRRDMFVDHDINEIQRSRAELMRSRNKY
ncbi:Uncharacterised protein [Plesiomonas shigelloides]|uniref:hypothetical protein n=1 Tax=Plesiomonas shigelloides TaxID=703 RepID=UPI0007EE254A|nr:hypothetical protein [Plesiomonas shigelloides]KAB7700403.1 hypothetical protein GBN33_05480 [Plesiomonas shigelloides]SBT61304.1 Uncharacterised protein [Plesiomonas shigelloides]